LLFILVYHSIFLPMHHTIYFNKKRIVLSDTKDAFVDKYIKMPKIRFVKTAHDKEISDIIKAIAEDDVEGAVFLHHSVLELLEAFKSKMDVIKAGGGLVHTDNNAVLLIYRKGKWDLPKGKLDAGETEAAAALREVSEEAGLTELQLEAPLTVTYHTYYEKEKLILKESHWFLMKADEQQNLAPQAEEDIEICEWVNLNALSSYLENTHPSIIDVLHLGSNALLHKETRY